MDHKRNTQTAVKTHFIFYCLEEQITSKGIKLTVMRKNRSVAVCGTERGGSIMCENTEGAEEKLWKIRRKNNCIESNAASQLHKLCAASTDKSVVNLYGRQK